MIIDLGVDLIARRLENLPVRLKLHQEDNSQGNLVNIFNMIFIRWNNNLVFLIDAINIFYGVKFYMI